MEYTTRVDAVVPALLTAWRAAFPTASVLDGPRSAQALADDVLVVGVGNSDRAEAYSMDVQEQPGLTARNQETLTIHCELSTWSGNQNAEVGPLRTRLAGILATIDTGFRADPHLGGSCESIRLGPRGRWYALESEDGPGMGAEFDVTARSWL